MKKLNFAIILLISLKAFYAVNGQNKNSNLTAIPEYSIRPVEGEINIDGFINDGGWRNTETVNNFWMSFPVDDKAAGPEIQTEVKMTYDNQFLYISAICHGPDNHIIQTLKRDSPLQQSDGFGVVIDPVNERTNGFVFGLNPMGVQTELLITGQTGRRQILEPGRTPQGINIAWDNKWFSEVQSFPDRWEVEIAIPFKTIRFDDEKKIWGINFFRIDSKTNSIHTWSPVPIEFTEFDLGYTGKLVWDNPPKKVKSNISIIPYALGGITRDFNNATPSESNFQAGVDGKIALTSSLNFDLAVNPNFSQVEIDEQVTNLTLFDIMLPEKRLFFLENSDVFEDFGIPPMRPFFSRRIGLDDEGNAIPILFGARVSGNATNNLRLGLMNLQTRETGDLLANNYTAVAFHQQVLSRSVIKGYLHNRQAINAENENFNRNAGLEFLYRSADGRMQGFMGYAKSLNPENNFKNYFYNTGVGYDSRSLSLYFNLAGVGDNYIADMGYFRGQKYYDAARDTTVRIGMNHWFTRGSYTIYAKKNKKIISHEIGFRNIMGYESNFSLINRDFEVNYNIRFTNTSIARAAYTTNKTNLLFPYSFTRSTPLPAKTYKYSSALIGYETDQRSLFSLTGSILYGSFYNGSRSQFLLGFKYRVQPWGNFALLFQHNKLKFPDGYGSKKLLNITPRIDFNFTKNLFWTTFMQYETQSDIFNINSRIQWRYQPLSDIYLVYTDSYSIEERIPRYRAVMLKVSYWLNL
ncbi:MAG: membrane associated [Prolixibacteraceae bacterium]|nr:MAG: membrane associated [Prolixibacteraceae bacterium]